MPLVNLEDFLKNKNSKSLAYEDLLGKQIKIIYLDDPYANYEGRVGVVTKVDTDPYGDTYLEGTWGGLSVYPSQDDFEVLNW